MKALCLGLIASSALISSSFSASVTVADNSAALPGVAAAVTALLLDAGLEPDEEEDDIFTVEARRVHCDQYSNAETDASDTQAGLPSVSCRIQSRNKKDTESGDRFPDGRAMVDLLQKIQVSNGRSIQLADCGSGGYCGFFARSIKCTINTEVTDFKDGGRWSCTIDDGQ